MPDRRGLCWIAAAASVVLAADLITKYYAWLYLRTSGPVTVIPGCLQLVYGENPGIAFGLFSDHGGWLHFVTPAAFVVLLAILLQQFGGQRMGWLLILIFGLIVGGALGNIVNRLYSGHVIDFIDAYYRGYHWYTFNIADSALTVGEVLLIGKLLFHRDPARQAEAPPGASLPAANEPAD